MVNQQTNNNFTTVRKENKTHANKNQNTRRNSGRTIMNREKQCNTSL